MLRLSGGKPVMSRPSTAIEPAATGTNPQILLLDEPLSNLDARIREEVRHEIKTLQQDLGITTVHVTHDRQEAMVMADRIAILDAGHVAQIGTPQEIYNRPNSPFVAGFMGATNVVPLTVSRVERQIIIAEGPLNCGVAIEHSGFLGAGIEPMSPGTSAVGHFRSEQARLCPPDQQLDGCLVLRGRITQASYPGGFYRYAVSVGHHQYLVDDQRRLRIGDAIGIALPAAALHLYPARNPAQNETSSISEVSSPPRKRGSRTNAEAWGFLDSRVRGNDR